MGALRHRGARAGVEGSRSLAFLGFLLPEDFALLGVCTKFPQSCPSSERSERAVAMASPRAVGSAGDSQLTVRSVTCTSLLICLSLQAKCFFCCFFFFSLRSVVL